MLVVGIAGFGSIYELRGLAIVFIVHSAVVFSYGLALGIGEPRRQVVVDCGTDWGNMACESRKIRLMTVQAKTATEHEVRPKLSKQTSHAGSDITKGRINLLHIGLIH